MANALMLGDANSSRVGLAGVEASMAMCSFVPQARLTSGVIAYSCAAATTLASRSPGMSVRLTEECICRTDVGGMDICTLLGVRILSQINLLILAIALLSFASNLP
jgi:hypothetical protein